MEPLLIDYGKYPCTGTYENRTVEVRMTVRGEPVVLGNVPQGACPICGSRVYGPAAVYVRGNLVYGDGEVVGERGSGRFFERSFTATERLEVRV
jgi:hypothetical protein